MRSPLTEIIQRVQAKADEIKALPPDEFNLFLDLLLPEPQEAKVKKTRKKRRALGPQAAAQREQTQSANLESGACSREGCAHAASSLIHDPKGGYAAYHPFESAPSAKKRSSTKGVAISSIPSSATQTDGVGDAARAVSGGD